MSLRLDHGKRKSRDPGGQTPEAGPGPQGRARHWRRSLVRSRTVAVIPTLFTLGNLLCGFLAVFFASRPTVSNLPLDWSPLTFAALFIFLGMVFDGLDGRIARLTRQTSDLGEQLDSMADMVTFGVAPAFIAVQLARVDTPFIFEVTNHTFDRFALVVACIYVACAALRLARFNIEAKSDDALDHMYFKGLPSPGAAGTVAALVLLHQHQLAYYIRQYKLDETLGPLFNMRLTITGVGMVTIMLLCALAMVSRFRYVHVTNRYVRGRASFNYVARVIILLALLLVRPVESFAGVFVVYALSGPVGWAWSRVRGRSRAVSAAAGKADSTEDDEQQPPRDAQQQAG